MISVELTEAQYLELEKIGLGAFSPLTGFMDEDEFWAVVDTMRLPDGSPFPIPVVLDVAQETKDRIGESGGANLAFQGEIVGRIKARSVFQADRSRVSEQVYRTASDDHPGVRAFKRLRPWFIGGEVELLKRAEMPISPHEITPQQSRAIFEERGWSTVVGFQTRNVPHRAHEYLHRVALEIADGLFLQPLVGQKKAGDFTPEAVLAGYRALIDGYYPAGRVLLGVLSTSMRYAGPREAVFHAILRRNYGCTHFIVGRDHAGVGNFYGLYDAHDLARTFGEELGIEILYLSGPFYSQSCGGIVTEKTCPEHLIGTDDTIEISGTRIRAILEAGEPLDPRLIRKDVVDALDGVELFIKETSE